LDASSESWNGSLSVRFNIRNLRYRRCSIVRAELPSRVLSVVNDQINEIVETHRRPIVGQDFNRRTTEMTSVTGGARDRRGSSQSGYRSKDAPGLRHLSALEIAES
jgi:hypothetical protein